MYSSFDVVGLRMFNVFGMVVNELLLNFCDEWLR